MLLFCYSLGEYPEGLKEGEKVNMVLPKRVLISGGYNRGGPRRPAQQRVCNPVQEGTTQHSIGRTIVKVTYL